MVAPEPRPLGTIHLSAVAGIGIHVMWRLSFRYSRDDACTIVKFSNSNVEGSAELVLGNPRGLQTSSVRSCPVDLILAGT